MSSKIPKTVCGQAPWNSACPYPLFGANGAVSSSLLVSTLGGCLEMFWIGVLGIVEEVLILAIESSFFIDTSLGKEISCFSFIVLLE